MTLHAFVDESTRRGRYLLGLTTCADADLATARRALRALRLPGQRRLHFAAEGDNQRRRILSGISGMGMCSTVYVADHDNQQDARAAILERAAHDLAGASVSRLTIESRAGQDHHDRAVLYRAFGPMPPLDDATRFPALTATTTGCGRLLEQERRCADVVHGAPGDGAALRSPCPHGDEPALVGAFGAHPAEVPTLSARAFRPVVHG